MRWIQSSIILASLTSSFAEKKAKATKTKKKSHGKMKVPGSPPLPGVSNNGNKPKVILAQALDWPPYTKIGQNLEISGFGPDVARGLEDVCDIDVTLVEAAWNQCWADKPSSKIGNGLLSGHYHGCTTFTATKGVRQRYLEFSNPILAMNKPAGILTRLEGGVPVVKGQSSLADINVGDVLGYAPTADVLSDTTNLCTGEIFSGFKLVSNDATTGKENDDALQQLLDGETDALWIYADQAYNYNIACEEDSEQPWDCKLWSKFGKDFAYIHTGMTDYMETGTTLAISKKGSGLSETLNPCIELFLKTKSYKDICTKYELEDDCFKNDFFDDTSDTKETPYYGTPTNELTTSCSDGYCPCT